MCTDYLEMYTGNPVTGATVLLQGIIRRSATEIFDNTVF